MNLDVSLGAALFAGAISFLSPCVLPLVPPYLCFITGTSLEDLVDNKMKPKEERRQVMLAALLFVLGFSTVFVALGGSRWHLLKLAFHLARRRLQPGTDVMLFAARDMEIQTSRRRPRIAYDGEKRRMRAPLRFRIHDHALSIIIPDAQDKVKP